SRSPRVRSRTLPLSGEDWELIVGASSTISNALLSIPYCLPLPTRKIGKSQIVKKIQLQTLSER
ncbi:hypothetical protein, partial [Bradyrhizobium glycinis]|uniref:hypothetical protein n=1 Tax=Bradyrhizobium glycinis TaxID=2751812 RepID=UPI001AEDE3A0